MSSSTSHHADAPAFPTVRELQLALAPRLDAALTRIAGLRARFDVAQQANLIEEPESVSPLLDVVPQLLLRASHALIIVDPNDAAKIVEGDTASNDEAMFKAIGITPDIQLVTAAEQRTFAEDRLQRAEILSERIEGMLPKPN